MVIRIYWASVTGNRKVDSDQTRLKNLVESLKFETEWIDITTSPVIKDQMRRQCGKPTAMPPQIFNEDVYLGTVDDLNDSVECGYARQWLKLEEENKEVNKVANGVEEIKSEQMDIVNGDKEKKLDVTAAKEIKQQEKESAKVEDSKVITKQITLSQPGKLSTGIISAFENNGAATSPTERRAVSISISAIKGESENDKKIKIDEERKRKLLGLPEVDATVTSNGDNETKNNGTFTTAPIKTFEEINKAAVNCSS